MAASKQDEQQFSVRITENTIMGSVAVIIAQAIKDAGVRVITHVPGYGANQIYTAIKKTFSHDPPISYNEEVGYSIAHGASIVGSRAATIFKSHGFVKAGNSIVDSLFAGNTAGFLNIIVDDKAGNHSDCIFDIQAYLEGIGIPFVYANPKDVYNNVVDGLEQSEALELPVVLVVDANLVEKDVSNEYREIKPAHTEFQPDICRFFLQPVFNSYQRQTFEAKISGKDWLSIPKPHIPIIPDDIPERWRQHMKLYRTLFDVFREMRPEIVCGDTGISHLYAFPPYNCFDLSTYMGGSIPLAIGVYLAGIHDVWALTGDFSFLSTGHLGIAEALQRDIPLKILIFFNGKAAATGGQTISGKVWEHVMEGYKPYMRYIENPQDTSEVSRVLNDSIRAEEMRIVVADYRRDSIPF